jgi:hypothetical protein
MQYFPPLLAYFGSEVQLPLMSFIAAVSALLVTVGGAPIRMIKRWLAEKKAKGESS